MPNRRFWRGGSKRIGIRAQVLKSGFEGVWTRVCPEPEVTDTGMAPCWPAIVAESARVQWRSLVLSADARHKLKISHNLLMRR